jgi:hypothetical protein
MNQTRAPIINALVQAGVISVGTKAAPPKGREANAKKLARPGVGGYNRKTRRGMAALARRDAKPKRGAAACAT